MHYRLRNVAVGHESLKAPIWDGEGWLYQFDGPTQGVFFRRNPMERRTLLRFNREEPFVFFKKNPLESRHLHRLDSTPAADVDGLVWSVHFRPFFEGDFNWPFIGPLVANNVDVAASPAGFTVRTDSRFYSPGDPRAGYWEVTVRAVAPNGWTPPLTITADLSGYDGAYLANTRYGDYAGEIENHPLALDAEGTVTFQAGGVVTAPMLASSTHEEARAAIQALQPVQDAGLAVSRLGVAPEFNSMLIYVGVALYWQFRTWQYFTGKLSTGTFTLTWQGETTAAISMEATSAEIAAALNLLPSISAHGHAIVTGLRRGTYSEAGYNYDTCGDNGFLTFKVSFDYD